MEDAYSFDLYQHPNEQLGCLMLVANNSTNIDIKELTKTLNIDINDIELQNSFNTLNPHITIIYGFPIDFDYTLLNNYINNIKNININVKGIDIFENGDYDILKLSIEHNQILTSLHTILKNNFKIETNFPKYQPHITLAYLKHGCGKKYVNKNFKYSFTANKFLYGVLNSITKQYLPYSKSWINV